MLIWSGEERVDLRNANIGVIEIDGVITESLPVLDQIRDFRKAKQLKALVLRVNSPGGAVGASQEIYMELKKLQKEVPVVASMGNVAASGGLYVSLGAQKVYALPGTVTGSMGVLMPITNLAKLMEKIYIEPISIKSGNLKDAGNPLKPLQPKAKEYLQDMVDRTFDQFRSHVQEERKMSDKDIEYLSDGRVVNGLQAQDLGLIHEIGNFEAAVEEAKSLAKLEDSKIVYLSREPKGLLEKVIEGAGAEIKDTLRPRALLYYLFDPGLGE